MEIINTISFEEFSRLDPKNFTGIIEYSNGSKRWLVNGELHREDGPAIEYSNGSKCWLLNGKYHREDGPAVERADGIKEYWLHNKEVDKKTVELHYMLKYKKVIEL